jgi:nitronate monooxygenase
LHYVTAPLRRLAREQGNPEHVNLWAGEAHALAEKLPAAEVVGKLVTQAKEALDSVARGTW